MDLGWMLAALLGLTLLLIITYVALAQRERVSNTLQLFTVLPSLGQAQTGDRILIVAPHPDDEVLMAAGYAGEALHHDAQVDVAILTMGDGFYFGAAGHYRRPRVGPRRYLAFGELRRRETEQSTAIWGDGRANLHFFGLPDRGLTRIWDRPWSAERPYRSPFTRSTHAPYAELVQPRLPYSGQAVAEALAGLVRRVRPTLLILPHPLDAHGDHWATAAFVDWVVARLRVGGAFSAGWPEPRRLYAVIHRGTRWPQPMGYYPYLPLRPPATLADLSPWLAYLVSQPSQQLKEQALAAHASQLPLLREFLFSFVRRNELFTEQAPIVLGREPVTIAHTEPLSREEAQVDGPAWGVPKRDTMAKDIQKMADIEALRLDLTEDGSLALTVETRRRASQRVIFQLEAHLFSQSDAGSGRLLLTFTPPSRLRVRRSLGAPDVDPAALSHRRVNGHWQLLLPLRALGSPQLMMFALKTRTRFGQQVDRTGWLTLELPPA